MRNQRRFSLEFKRQVVEEFLSGEGAAQLCRKYNICSSLLYHWKDMYSRDKFNNEPTEVGALKDKVEKVGENHQLKAPLPQICQSHQGDGPEPLKPGVTGRYHLYPHPDWLRLPGGHS